MPSHQVCHAHCPPPRRGGAALIALAALTGTALIAGRAAAPAIETAIAQTIEALKIAAIVAGSAAVLTAAGWIVHTTRTAHRTPAADAAEAAPVRPGTSGPAPVRPAYTLAPPTRAADRLPAGRWARQAIEAPNPWAAEADGLTTPARRPRRANRVS